MNKQLLINIEPSESRFILIHVHNIIIHHLVSLSKSFISAKSARLVRLEAPASSGTSSSSRQIILLFDGVKSTPSITLGQDHTSFPFQFAMLLLPHRLRLHNSERTMIGSLYSQVESVDSMLHSCCEIFEVGFRHRRGNMHNYCFRSGRFVKRTVNNDHCLSFVMVDVGDATEVEISLQDRGVH